MDQNSSQFVNLSLVKRNKCLYCCGWRTIPIFTWLTGGIIKYKYLEFFLSGETGRNPDHASSLKLCSPQALEEVAVRHRFAYLFSKSSLSVDGWFRVVPFPFGQFKTETESKSSSWLGRKMKTLYHSPSTPVSPPSFPSPFLYIWPLFSSLPSLSSIFSSHTPFRKWIPSIILWHKQLFMYLHRSRGMKMKR